MRGPSDDPAHEAVRTARRTGFGAEAERYDRVRPTYPASLFDAIAARGAMRTGSTVLEIGPGTGQATVPMLDRGWSVEAVEIDPAMAALADRRTGGRARIRVEAFEDLHPAEPVDLVLAATSFHWLDPHDRLDRIAAALRPGGTIAIVWTRHVRGGTQASFDAADACYRVHGGDDRGMPLLDQTEVGPPIQDLVASDRFVGVDVQRFSTETATTTEQYLDLQRTQSPTLALPEAQRTALLTCLAELLDRDFGGRVVKRLIFDLVLATRV